MNCCVMEMNADNELNLNCKLLRCCKQNAIICCEVQLKYCEKEIIVNCIQHFASQDGKKKSIRK